MRTKSVILIVSAIILVVAGGAGLVFVKVAKKPVSSEKNSVQVLYHCPMHTTYFSNKPGDCPICGMKLVPVNAEGSPGSKNSERKILYYRDPEKPWATSEKPGKTAEGKELEPVYEDDAAAGHAIKIEPAVVQNMGVATEKVKVRKLQRDIRTGGNVEINETRVSVVNAKVMGWVEKLYVDFTGQEVKAGQKLLDLYSPELVSAQEEYLEALRYRKSLLTSTPEARDGAANLIASAKQRLLNWDMSEQDLARLETEQRAQRTIPFYAPVNGIVLEKMVVTGQNVMPGMAFYKIADVSRVWVIANVYQDDLPFIATGQSAKIELASQPGRLLKGVVSFISPVLDMSSKTAQVRIEVENTQDHPLKPNMFASVQIVSPLSVSAVSVPEQSVIRSGKRNIVIVALGNGYFKPLEVRLGISAQGYVQVLNGLHEGETIVTSSQFLIDSESNLAAVVRQMTSQPEEEQKIEKDSVAGHAPGHQHSSRGTGGDSKTVNTPGQKKLKSEQKVVYTCPMHPQIVQDHPGKCPLCGMNLVRKQTTSENSNHETGAVRTVGFDTISNAAAKENQAILYTCSMDPDIIQDKPGNCPRCGMRLIVKNK